NRWQLTSAGNDLVAWTDASIQSQNKQIDPFLALILKKPALNSKRASRNLTSSPPHSKNCNTALVFWCLYDFGE
ncbi:MAG: hypothetical protein K2Q15_09350, partial [Burkholderiales bacterium]|nr:hypothetical protein [Burkholderiales bacterium]